MNNATQQADLQVDANKNDVEQVDEGRAEKHRCFLGFCEIFCLVFFAIYDICCRKTMERNASNDYATIGSAFFCFAVFIVSFGLMMLTLIVVGVLAILGVFND